MHPWVPVCSILIWAASAVAAPLSDGMIQTIDAMERAVLSGDLGAYMALIDTDDAMVLNEQRAWFDDLALKPIKSFSIETQDGLGYELENGFAAFTARFVWTLESDGIQRELEAQIRLSSLSPDLSGPWYFAGRDWEVAEIDPESGVRVFADAKHKDLAKRVLTMVSGIQSGIEDEFGRELRVPLTIKIYATMQELQFSIAPGYLDPLSGWNEPGESIKILGRNSVSDERSSSLLAHEIGHAVSFEFGEQIINAPWWSLEGIAELVADRYRSDPDQRAVGIARQVARGDRRSWNQLSDFKGEALNHTMYVYSQGWSMVRFITQRYGKDARNRWMSEMGRGSSVEEATLSVLRISFEDLDLAWESEMISIAQQAADESESGD